MLRSRVNKNSAASDLFLFSFNICRSVPGPDVGGPDQGEQGEAEPRPAASHGHHGLQQ